MNTGLFVENKMMKLIDPVYPDGTSYAIQYSCESNEKLEEYQTKHAPQLQQEHIDRYKDKFGAFRTILEVM